MKNYKISRISGSTFIYNRKRKYPIITRSIVVVNDGVDVLFGAVDCRTDTGISPGASGNILENRT